MSGFGPFKPRAVFPAGWYFKPIRQTINRSRVATNTRRFPAKRTGPRRPIVVQLAGWYFKPIRTTMTKSRIVTNVRRRPSYDYVVTKAVIPTNTVAPVASGTAQDGQLVSTTDGTWTGTTPRTDGSAYQWQTASDAGFTTSVADIGGATANSYLLTGAEIGLYVRCVVSSINIAAIGLGYSNALGPVIP